MHEYNNAETIITGEHESDIMDVVPKQHNCK